MWIPLRASRTHCAPLSTTIGKYYHPTFSSCFCRSFFSIWFLPLPTPTDQFISNPLFLLPPPSSLFPPPSSLLPPSLPSPTSLPSDEQFHWIQEALGVRKVQIYSFGKMNFVNTVLSKRKLNWFVEQKLVEGWFDPRFPTIQGCVRRGVSVDALKNFIISQGASRRVITMEWDKFWAENKRVLEESSARYMGVSAKDMVKFTVTNLPTTDISCVSVQVHPQKPEQGFRVMRQYHEILIDQIDAATFAVGEEVTFLRWGNFFIDEITKDAAGLVTAMTGRYHPEATNFSKTKKTTWLASVPDLVSCTLVQYDHLITKAKLDENDNFQDFVNPHTKSESSAWCDPLLRSVQEGQVIQLERKGFYRCDKAYASGSAAAEAGAIVLIAIPDGKQVKGAPVAQPKAGGKKK